MNFNHYSQIINKKIHSCVLTLSDISSLASVLAQKAQESLQYDLDDIKANNSIPIEKLEEFKKLFLDGPAKLLIEIKGTNGEFIQSTDLTIFENKSLPKNIASIKFSSNVLYSKAIREPQNMFELTLDFSKTDILDFRNLINFPASNSSHLIICGKNDTWVNGVCKKIMETLGEKKTKRNWLHSRFAYDFLLYFLFFPLTFRITYLIGQYLHLERLKNPLSIAVYVYLFVFCLFIFRILFNYTKWIFPMLEFEQNKTGFRHKAFWNAIMIGVTGSAAYDLIKIIWTYLSS